MVMKDCHMLAEGRCSMLQSRLVVFEVTARFLGNEVKNYDD